MGVPTRAQVLIPIGAAAFIIGIIGVMTIPSDVKLDLVDFPRGTIKIDDVVLTVQIADTDALRARGLMFQDEMPYDQGMLFVFDEPSVRSMWMLNMQFPLDIIWLDGEGKVVHIEKDVAPCKSPLETAACTHQNAESKDAQYVLEVTSGFVDKFDIQLGSQLEIISI